jgi:ABC-type transport system involved in multi-copper enzyme maturation permease subunit
MTRALVWKELREQWIVWLALALATVGAAAGLLGLVSAGTGRDDLLVALLWLAAWGYGMLCGALVLGGDTEDGTQTFLDALPVTRRGLWNTKAGTGLGLLALQLLAFIVIGYLCTNRVYLSSRVVNDLLQLLLAGAIGYAWGLTCGSFAASVLNAVGWAVLFQAASGVFVYGLVMAITRAYFRWLSAETLQKIWFAAAIAITAGATYRSRSFYCHRERLREVSNERPGSKPVETPWIGLLWLTWRQMRGFAIAMTILALFGVVVMVSQRMVVWPLLTLFIGILCGATTFGDEQSSGAFRFLGDQRFPMGRIWLAKVVGRFSIGLWSTGLIAAGIAAILTVRAAVAPSVELRQFEADFDASLLSVPLSQPYLCLTLWLGYGYAIGLLFGVLFNKPLISTVVAVGIALPVVLMWMPSLLVTAGLHLWQVWVVPAIILIGARWLTGLRAADRLWSRQGVLFTVITAVAAGLALAVALGYRAIEIPVPPDVIDVEAFQSTLP